MKIATWNVNSVRSRETHVRRWLEHHTPDLLFLQEIKCEAPSFPMEGFGALGYRCEVVGQKTYNGVAVLARVPITVTRRALPGDDTDAPARSIEVQAEGLTVGGLYLPNGNSGGEDGYRFKLAWMDRLYEHARAVLAQDTPLILLGDYNVCPTDDDFAPGALGENDALVRPATRARFRSLIWLGLTDAVRALQPRGNVYTFWDYQAGAWPRNRGLRIDHALLSPTVAERLVTAKPHRETRGEEQPSDHVPVMVELSD
jgi:exodeoxyribonuclease-3